MERGAWSVLPSGRGRRRGREFAGGTGPGSQELLGLEEEGGADGRLIKPAGVEGADAGELGETGVCRGQLGQRQAAVEPGDVDLDEEVKAGKGAIGQTTPGLEGRADGVPDVALLFSEGAPAGGDQGEDEADGDLLGGAGIERDKGGVPDLFIAITLIDDAGDLPGFGAGRCHNKLVNGHN